MTKELKQQFKMRIVNANKTELIVILYEMFLQYMEDGKDALKAEDETAFQDALAHGRGCIKQLMQSLNFQYEPAGALKQLYLYINRELVQADIHKSEEPLDHAIMVIKELWEAYAEISSQDTSPAVMVNSQNVYAGLTYGRDDLVENLDKVGENRGFLV